MATIICFMKLIVYAIPYVYAHSMQKLLQPLEDLQSNQDWELDALNCALSVLIERKDSVTAYVITKDDRFDLRYLGTCSRRNISEIMRLINAFVNFKMEDLLVKFADELSVFEYHGNRTFLSPFLSYKYQTVEDIIKMEEGALNLYRALRKNRFWDAFMPVRYLITNPIFPVQRTDRALTHNWNYVLWTLIRDQDIANLNLVLIYWPQFRQRIDVSLVHVRKLLARIKRTPHALLSLSLNRGIYDLILENRLLCSDQIEMMPSSFASCYERSLSFDHYLAQLQEEFEGDKFFEFSRYCLINDSFGLKDLIDNAIQRHNIRILVEMTYHIAPPFLTGSQFSQLFIECQNPDHQLFKHFHSDTVFCYEIEELHLHFKPVPFVIFELLSENLYLLNGFHLEDFLSFNKEKGSFALLQKLARACKLRDDILKFVGSLAPCLQRYFRRPPNMISRADELYFILKTTMNNAYVHSYVQPFLSVASEKVLEEVLKLALGEKMKHIVREVDRIKLTVRFHPI